MAFAEERAAEPGRGEEDTGSRSCGRDASRGYALSTWAFLRLLGVAYLAAFVSIRTQLEGLFGTHGIIPLDERMRRLGEAREIGFWDVPTLAWWTGGDLDLPCVLGVVFSATLAAGLLPKVSVLACWLLYLSVVAAGSPFMTYQWDALLLEAGFTASLVAPAVVWSSPRAAREPWVVGRWLLYWLLFRLMFSSGVVKLASGDEAWANLTALTHHYETQPLPHVLGWWAHQLPDWAHIASAAGTFGVELAVPFLVLWPGRPRLVACALLISLQILIAATGNYGFFNLLTVALCVPLLDDAACRRLVPPGWRPRLVRRPGDAEGPSHDTWVRWRRYPAWAAAALVAVLSTAQLGLTVLPRGLAKPFHTLSSPFSGLHTFNTYGLFAVMTTERPEIVIEGSSDGRTWKEYALRWKPGDVREPPAYSGLHMPRLDWQMWFAALGNIRRNGWMVGLMRRLLEGQPEVLDLLSHNPFPEAPPRYIRAVRYDYRFTDPRTLDKTGRWWHRERLGPYSPTLRRRGRGR